MAGMIKIDNINFRKDGASSSTLSNGAYFSSPRTFFSNRSRMSAVFSRSESPIEDSDSTCFFISVSPRDESASTFVLVSSRPPVLFKDQIAKTKAEIAIIRLIHSIRLSSFILRMISLPLNSVYLLSSLLEADLGNLLATSLETGLQIEHPGWKIDE